MEWNSFNVIDNYLPKKDFINIQSKLGSSDFSWFLNKYVALPGSKDGLYFTHTFYRNYLPNSNEFTVLTPLLNKLNATSLIRVKANLYPRTDKIFEHNKHVDVHDELNQPIPHKGFIFYINTNNGFTRLQNGEKIKSVENRALFFEAHKLHNSSTCTDESVRININFNYF